MKNFTIYQIRISDEIHNYVNSNDAGHSGAAKKYPKYGVHLDSMAGSSKWDDSYFQHYDKVCEVKVDGGLNYGSEDQPFVIDNLEDVFRVLNGYHYSEDDQEDPVFDAHVTGYRLKTVTRKNGEQVTYRDMHSLSVGDIVQDPNGKFYLCDSFGFKEILTTETGLTHFIDDEEKMEDFKNLTKEEFLNSYSYLTDFEYELTKKEVSI